MKTVTIDMGFRPRPWQVRYLESRKRFNVLVIHRRAGKTVVAVRQLIDSACRCTLANPRFAYVAPLFKQAKATAWQYLKDYTAMIPGRVVNESECWVGLPNGARIRIYGADNPDSLRGLYHDGVVLDEIAQMSPVVWYEIIRPALADRLGWMLAIGTPKGLNLLSELYFAAVRDDKWYAARFTVDDTNAIPREELEDARKAMDEATYRREFLCDFSAGGDATLFSLDDVSEACQRHAREHEYTFAPRVLGVDVARFGDDRSVIFSRQGVASWEPIAMTGKDTTQVAQRVAERIAEWQPHAVFIDGTGGYGAGVIDRLRLLGHRVYDVQFGGKASDPRYLNKRAEMWFSMQRWLSQGGCLPDMAALRADLCTPTYSVNASGKMQLESKEEIKKRGLPSPDYADALALTFAQPVAAPDSQVKRAVATTANRVEYKPFGRTRF